MFSSLFPANGINEMERFILWLHFLTALTMIPFLIGRLQSMTSIFSFVFFKALKATQDVLNQEGYECATYVVDISDKEQVYEVAKKVKIEIGKVDILINNAGVVTCRTLLDLPDKAIETTYGVNILSHYWVSCFLLIWKMTKFYEAFLFLDSESFSAWHDCWQRRSYCNSELGHRFTWNLCMHRLFCHKICLRWISREFVQWTSSTQSWLCGHDTRLSLLHQHRHVHRREASLISHARTKIRCRKNCWICFKEWSELYTSRNRSNASAT